jgi:hypothetical protein
MGKAEATKHLRYLPIFASASSRAGSAIAHGSCRPLATHYSRQYRWKLFISFGVQMNVVRPRHAGCFSDSDSRPPAAVILGGVNVKVTGPESNRRD